MHLSRANTPEIFPLADRGTRLVGWKDIAAYLGKTDRTVKRWGRDRGLPVHRVPGTAKTSVYAYSYELDRWLKNADAETENQAEEAGPPLPAPDPIPNPVPDPIVPQGTPVTVLPTTRLRSLLRRRWLLAGMALLLAVVTLDVAIRLRAVPLAMALRNLMAGHAKADAPPAVSETLAGVR